MLIMRGKMEARKVSTYQGQERVTFQFLERDEKGALVFIEVKAPDNFEHQQYKDGQDMEFPVVVTAMQGRLYYKMAGLPTGHKSAK